MTDMSSVSTKGGSDTAPTPPLFSYAQAAKGKIAVPFSAQASKAGSVTSNTSKDHTTSTAATPAVTASGNSGAPSDHTASPVPNPRPEELLNGVDSKPSDANLLVASPSPQRQLPSPAIPISTPSSPDFGTASTSTLQKEDDISSQPNTSSESTWDKQSQGSMQADKMSDHTGGDGEKSKEKETEKVSPALVPAAVPVENVWERRAKETAAKAKLNQQNSALTQHAVPKAPSNMTSANGHNSGPAFQGGKAHVEKTNDQGKSDSRRKGRYTNGTGEETEKTLPGQVGDRKDTGGFGREKRKSFDGHNKYREDYPRRTGARGKGSPEKGKDNSNVLAPPPVDDSTSWPTPELAQSEDKKRVQEKGEKLDKEKPVVAGAKSHGKEKWMPVPYTPTVIYNTPLPLRGRGGKSTRGGRGGAHSGNAVTNGAGGGTAVQTPTTADANDRSVPESPARSDSTVLPLRPAKRSTSPGPGPSNTNRKPSHTSIPDKRRDNEFAGSHEQDVGPSTTSPTSRRTSTATQTDNTQRFRQEYRSGHRSDAGQFNGHGQPGDRNDRGHSHHNDSHTHPRSAGPDRRGDGFARGSDHYKENGGYMPSRERGEGRSERGRGGYRGPRGGSNNGFANGQHSGHTYANGHHTHQHNSSNYSYPKPQSSYPAPQQPSQQAGHYGHTQQQLRNHRAGSRSHSLPNHVMYNGFVPGVPAAQPQLPPLQTQVGPIFDYQSIQMMSAIAYSPLAGQYTDLSRALIGQLEYYFSIENLCKDMYLRRHMDSQGFVPLEVVANFNRVKQLTEDLDTIRYACYVSPELEFLTGPDNIDRLRKQRDWQQWVLAVENRDPLAQNDGPTELHQPNPPFPQQAVSDGQYMADHPQLSTSPIEMMVVGDPLFVDGPTNVPLNGVAPSFVPADETPASETIVNGKSGTVATPLSAAVADFSPSIPSSNGNASPEPEREDRNVFTDAQVESLVIVVRKPGNGKPGMPFRNASSRTFSNGSIDGRTIADELDRHEERQSRSLTTRSSDVFEPENLQGPRSPFDPSSPRKLHAGNPSPVLWVKDRATSMDSLPDDVTHESYQVFRRNALKQREQCGPGKSHRDMDVLYEFWSHFLIRNFNPRMFEEFRRLAHEDATERQSTVGTKHLIQYYDESLASKNTIPEEIARHYVQFVKSEDHSKERPGFEKLRAAWHNDALNVKNRMKINTLIDPELKAELER